VDHQRQHGQADAAREDRPHVEDGRELNQSSPYPPIISVGKGSTTIVSSHAIQNRSGVESATTLTNKRRRTTQSRAR
jgi:hypothetical protein